ncbi:hypothetical protein [Rickettsia honei]|uniref:hypothetical protein n=1 Tax=Rickettsia honei TaxID=37816 RepID=UPI000317BB3E|nr:hypothetical protein [Rickettsia honei]
MGINLKYYVWDQKKKNHQLFYDTSSQRLLDANGKVASTIGKESKSMNHVQAFVMGEDGTIYMGTHKNQYLPNTKNTCSRFIFKWKACGSIRIYRYK